MKTPGFSVAGLAVFALTLNLIFLGGKSEADVSGLDLGGPLGSSPEFNAAAEPSVEQNGIPGRSDSAEDDFLGFLLLDDGIVFGSSNPLSNVLPTREGLMVYRIKEGDTIYSIAANFGISVETVVWANPNLKPSFIKPGEELVVLPVSGLLHKVKSGDSLDGIAAVYGVKDEEVKRFNPAFQKIIQAQGTLIIPQAKPVKTFRQPLAVNKLADLGSYFIIPSTGWNWGRLHDYNAVDIANACGTAVYAAAEGLVIEAGSPRVWNTGYGGFLKVEHPNGVYTLYAHLQKTSVSTGSYVLQGDEIGKMGNTGNVHGPTGCHLHFEVHKASNPFVK